jgi:hypothetical protein
MGVFITKTAEGQPTDFAFDRFLIAVALFGILYAVAILADAKNWVDDPSKLYDTASTVLGIVIGFLGGEATAAAD